MISYILYALYTLCSALILYLIIEWHWLIPGKGNIAILMYHQISSDNANSADLVVSAERFRQHLEILKHKKYHIVSFSKLIEMEKSGDLTKDNKGKYAVLTFDDGYLDNQELLLPILEEHQISASIFLTVGLIGKTNTWDGGSEQLLNYEQLTAMSKSPCIEFALHSYNHQSYSDLSIDDIQKDIEKCTDQLTAHNIPYLPVIAYPFGAYPKRDAEKKQQLFQLFKNMNISHALRIGNQKCKLPFAQPYEIRRINAKGTDSLLTFKVKLNKGNRKLFG